VFRTGGTYPIVALKNSEGTLHCENFAFFGRNGHDVVPIAGPILDATPDDLCWIAHGDIAQFENEPLFIASSDETTKSELLAFHVVGPEPMAPFCHLMIQFNVEFEVSDSSCKHSFCTDLRKQLPALAERFAATGTANFGAPEAVTVPRAVLDALQRRSGYATLPLAPLHFYRVDIDNDGAYEFLAIEAIADQPRILYVIDSPDGAFLKTASITVTALADLPGADELTNVPADTDFLSPYIRFEEPSDYFPMLIGKTVYLARMGGGSFGWRILDGYLLGLYELTGGKIAAAAGFALKRVNASVKGVEVAQ
jgi:hypothetical protein